MTIVAPLRMRSVGGDPDELSSFYIEKLRDLCFPTEFGDRVNFVPSTDVATPETVLAESLADEILKKIEIELRQGETVVIDVGGPGFQEAVAPKVAAALAQVVTQLGISCPGTRVIVLMQREPMDHDRFFASLQNACASYAGIIVYAAAGTTYNSSGDRNVSSAFASKIQSWNNAQRSSNEEALSKKLIRHRGFYSIPMADHTTVSVFDGRNCIGEISELIIKRLSERFVGTNRVVVLVDDKNSPWLGKAAAAAQMQSSGKYVFLLTSEIDLESNTDDFDAVLFSVMRSGNSARSIIMNVGARLRADAFLWSLVSLEDVVGRPTSPHFKTLDLPQGRASDIMIEIVKDVAEDNLLNSLWRRSGIDPFPIHHISLHEPFRSDEIWSLLLESGIKREEDVPPSRGQFEWVPDMVRFAEVHGPLLAGKISASLDVQRETSNKPEGIYFFVHPKETAAEALVSYICGMTRKRAIGVPRPLIMKAGVAKDLDHLRQSLDSQLLVTQLDRLLAVAADYALSVYGASGQRQQVKVVLIDEFSGSGQTLYDLKRLCGMMNWDVQSIICPIMMAGWTPQNEIITHSYYQFGIPLV